jgi:hypothetical protein
VLNVGVVRVGAANDPYGGTPSVAAQTSVRLEIVLAAQSLWSARAGLRALAIAVKHLRRFIRSVSARPAAGRILLLRWLYISKRRIV